MKNTALVSVLALVAVLAGCQDRKQYAEHLMAAQEALVVDFPELAEHRLGEAEKLAARSKVVSPNPVAQLLLAEVRIQQGNLDGARRLVAQARLGSAPGTTARAQVEEITAKIAIRRGEFIVAQQHLIEAERNCTSDGDRARIADLILLTRGLHAYSDGDVRAAHGHWQSIRDSQMKLSVTSSIWQSRHVVVGAN